MKRRSFKPGNLVSFSIMDIGINLTTGKREFAPAPEKFRGQTLTVKGLLQVQFDGPIWLVRTKQGEIFKVHERQMAFAD